MIVIPAIDLKDGKCVRLFQGDFDNETIYNENPEKIGQNFQKQGAKRLHIIDLDGARSGKVCNFNIIKKIVRLVEIPVQVGGGIQDEKTIESLLSIGVKYVILGTVALENSLLLKKLLQKYSQNIIVSLDARAGKLMKRGWLEATDTDIISAVKSLAKLGVKCFIYTDIKKDGTLTEPNYWEIKSLIKEVNVPIIIAGGVSSIESIKKLNQIGAYGAIVGKAIYEDKINIKEAFKID